MAVRALGVAPATATDAATKGYVDALVGIASVVTLTTSATATADALHIVDLPSGTAIWTMTLPAAPAQNTLCEFYRKDANFGFGAGAMCQIIPGGSDTFNTGVTNPQQLVGSGLAIRFMYLGTTWYVIGTTLGQAHSMYGARSTHTVGFEPNLMSRDASGRSQVNDPSALADIATFNMIGSLKSGGNKTAAFSALANTHYTITLAASLGAVAATLPSTPGQGTVCAFTRLDGQWLSSFAQIAAGAGDTVVGGTYGLQAQNGSVALIYLGTTWVVLSNGWANTSGNTGISSSAIAATIAARDSNGRMQVTAPDGSDPLHAANQAYVLANAGSAPGDQLLLAACFR